MSVNTNKREMVDLSCVVNGEAVALKINSSDDLTLLDVLRDHLHITSPKNGCQPQAQCGCCTVLVEGKPMLSCTMKLAKFQGKEIVTLEGLPELQREQLAEAFVKSGGIQCGFCIPGIAIRAAALCDDTKKAGIKLTRQNIEKTLQPHLCRCTGYKQIVDSIELYNDLRNGEVYADNSGSAESSGKVGTSLGRYAGSETVLGDRAFVDDMQVDGMMYGALRLADHPRARIWKIDYTPVLAIKGVHRVVTARDIPGEQKVGLIECDWPVFIGLGESTNCVGDVIAGVIADSQQLARRAASLIEVGYDVSEPVVCPHKALEKGAPLVHQERGTNLLSESVIKKGDVDKAFAESAHIIEDTYQTQHIEHLFLEPESCIAVPEGEEIDKRTIVVYSQGQGVYDDQRQLASVLGVETKRVQVNLVSNGGAFGGKEDLSIQAHTSLMAWLVGKPVKVTLTRPESFRIHPKRHPIELTYKIGCDAEGRLLAVKARIIGDKGAYASVGAKVLERAGSHCTGPYRIENIDVQSLAVYTNNPPCGAMRGFGANQAAFAIESLLDRLAEKVGIDGYDIRERNILRPGDTFATGQIMDKPFGLKQTLEAVRKQYKSARYAGIACGIKNVGIGNGMPDIGRAALTVESEDCIHIRTGFTEMGQGLFTVCVQFAVEATGLASEIFKVSTDTMLDLDCGQTTASRATVLAGNAIAEAGRALMSELGKGKTLADMIGRDFYGEWICDYTSKAGAGFEKPGGPKTHLTYGFATQVAILDEETGKLKKIIAAHDVGKVINPLQLEGQIYGALHMGIGYALSEDFKIEGGRILSRTIKDCGVLRAQQMPPELELIFIEEPDPECPFGARGVGEIGLVPTAPAIGNALYKYDGIVRNSLPMKNYEGV